MEPYTPGAAVAVAQVVLVGMLVTIAHKAIAANVQGDVAIGGGVYNVKNINGAATGAKVYWDGTNNGVTTTAAGNSVFGFIASGGGGAANSQCNAMHAPYN
jgi:predicted RecA/RadA family phage recombinase